MPSPYRKGATSSAARSTRPIHKSSGARSGGARGSRAAAGRIRIEPATRQRGADYVFDALARSILSGELQPGSALATQRELAEQFDISMLVVRQAIHRLEDLGLLRVRQGSATIVLDPNEATDIRLMALRMELAPTLPGLTRAAREIQILFALPMIVLAERRITREELGVLQYLIDSLPADPSQEEVRRFLSEFWRQVAKATHNPLYQQQVSWWSALARSIEQRYRNADPPVPRAFPVRAAGVRGFYQALVRALAAHEGAVATFLAAMGLVLDRFDQYEQQRAQR